MKGLKLHSLFTLVIINLLLRILSVRFADVRIGRGSWLKGKLEIGTGSRLGWNFCVRGAGKLVMGKYCAVGENVRVITSNHETQCLIMNYSLQEKVVGKRYVAGRIDVTIGNDVWIGDGVTILSGVTIGNGAIIGAGSVVTKSVAPFTVVAGNPARFIRSRFTPEVAAEISRINWWDWPLTEMQYKKGIFAEIHPRPSDRSRTENS